MLWIFLQNEKKWKRMRLNLYATSCIFKGKHIFGLHTINKRKQDIISINSAIFNSFLNFYTSKAWIIQGLHDSFHISLLHLLSHVMLTWDIYIYICITNTHSLINSQSWCSTCGHCRLGAHRIANLNFLVQSVEYEGPLDWRGAGPGRKVI